MARLVFDEQRHVARVGADRQVWGECRLDLVLESGVAHGHRKVRKNLFVDPLVRRVFGVSRKDQIGESAKRIGGVGREPGDILEPCDARQGEREGRLPGKELT